MTHSSDVQGLYLDHRSRLVSYAQRLVGDAGQAEDIVQEAFLRLNSALARRWPAEPLSYLFQIVRNLAVDGQRRRTLERRSFVAGAEYAMADAADEQPSQEAQLASRDDLRVVAEAMSELPERTRRALELYRFGDCKLHDVAERLGISVGLAHKLVADGLAHCRDRLARAG